MSKKSKKKPLKEEEKTSKAKKKDQQKAKDKGKKAEKKPKKSSAKVSSEQRLEMIATAAYYIAERHGFTPGESEADWRAAEKEIDDLLKKQRKKQAKH